MSGSNISFLLFLFFTTNVSIVVLFNVFHFILNVNKLSDTDVQLIDLEFQDYVKKFNKCYGIEELNKTQRYFRESLKEISRLNAHHGTPVFGVNKFSDWSPYEKSRLIPAKTEGTCVEIRQQCHGNYTRRSSKRNHVVKHLYLPHEDLPQKVDWREKGKVGKVIDQKMCRGCWAMTIVGVMESMWAISGHKLYDLSIQELIDCSTMTNRCEGGDIGRALRFLCWHDYPVLRESKYPLRLQDQPCRMPKRRNLAGRRVAEFTNECDMDTETLLRQLTRGPVVAVVNAHHWVYYNAGVISKACDAQWVNLRHAVQIVGFDLTAEIPHYIIRNSWGSDWGEDGYARLAIDGNVCGITSSVAYFTVK